MISSLIEHVIIAHRGASFEAPENTLAAIQMAWDQGIKAVEIDIHLSKDAYIVAIHDNTTQRIGNQNKKVREQTLKELKVLDVGHWKDPKWLREKIPTLQEILDTIPKDGKLIIELKTYIPPDHFTELLNQYTFKHHQIEFISFDLTLITQIKVTFPHFRSLLLLDLDYNAQTAKHIPDIEETLTSVRNANLDGIDIWAGPLAKNLWVPLFKNQGLIVYIWTINKPKEALAFFQLGVDGITTDRAYWLTQKTKAQFK